jgi:methionine sulfoxide reductase heme-binding subunit
MIQWYAIRATGVVTLMLFSGTVVLGLLNRSRVASDGWPRFVIDRLHRNLSLLSVTFLAIHIVTASTDSFVSIDLVNAFVPFSHSYSTFWIGLGAVACDLLIALVITSLIRARLGIKAWRSVHWLAYLAWPVAVAHGIGNGTDAGQSWMIAIDVLCIGAVLTALTLRLSAPSSVLEQAW